MPSARAPKFGAVPLNTPLPVTVEADASGVPLAVTMRGTRRVVEAINDTWRLDDEWWRAKPISRMYWDVVTDLGGLVTLYHDLDSGQWYTQRGMAG